MHILEKADSIIFLEIKISVLVYIHIHNTHDFCKHNQQRMEIWFVQRAFVSNCTPHATEAFSPIDHQSRGLWGPSYRGSSAGVSGCLSMFHTIVIGWSPVASHFNLTTSPFRAVSLRNLLSKRGGTEIIRNFKVMNSSSKWQSIYKWHIFQQDKIF